MKKNRRLQILAEQELLAIYDRPRFNDAERRHYFSLSESELASVKLRSINGVAASAKLYLILQIGYFKAKHLFFNFQYIDVMDDCTFILSTYMPNDLAPERLPTRTVQLKAKNNILNLFGFQDDLEIINDFISERSCMIVRKTNDPADVFNYLKDMLEKNQMVLPPYSRLQDAIGMALENEERRIIEIIKNNLTEDTEISIKKLLEIEDVFYKITQLKFDAKTFQTQEMQEELNKLKTCEVIYLFSKQVLPKTELSRKNIAYYSDMVKYYTVYKLKRLPKELAYFYLTCYVHIRYEKIVNNLIQGFFYYVDKYTSDAKKYADNNVPNSNTTINKYRKQAGELIRWYSDDSVMNEPGRLIQEKAYNLMTKDEVISLSQVLLEDNDSDTETALIWKYHKNNYRRILLNLRPLFSVIDLEASPKLDCLMEAIYYLKNIFIHNKKLKDVDFSEIPISHISPKKMLHYILETDSTVVFTDASESPLNIGTVVSFSDGDASINTAITAENEPVFEIEKSLIYADNIETTISHHMMTGAVTHSTDVLVKSIDEPEENKIMNTYQYEFYIYNAIRANIKKGLIFINNSIGYKSFENDIKIPPNWENDKEKILKDLNNPVLLTSIDDTLNFLQDILEPLIIRVNERAINGENKHIKIKSHRNGTTSWTIPYPKKNDEIDNPFYSRADTITISEAFDFIEQRSKFMGAFKHIKPRYSKNKQDYLGIKAGILANGTTQGIHEFAKRSNLTYQRLKTAEQNHIRLETLRDAASMIVDYLVSLPIFDSYDLNDQRHGSIDGKKKKTKRRILKSRHSPKYFGLDIGVVIMTMNSNHVPFVTNIIGANEHEGHFTYSMLMENLTSIDPAIISTDTAGTNNVNDFLYYLIGKTHAACYRSTADKAETISGFQSLEKYKGLLIAPKRKVKQDTIKEKWPDLLPVLVALLSHETTQDIIVAKLSSHEYKSDIKEALWELNNILKSIHLLKYIDDPEYRKNIRTSLNRGEAYHQLLDKITDVGSGDFRGMSELEVEIWNECTRLIALIIIAYNMSILSELYELKVKQGDKAAIEFLKHISPIASQHLNISGLYEFNEGVALINIHAVVDTLTKILDATLKG